MVNVTDKLFSFVLMSEAQYVCFLLHLGFIISYIFVYALLEVNIGIFLSPFRKVNYFMGKYKW